MTLRGRLLGGFVVTAMVVVVVFGFISHRVAEDHADAEERHLLVSTANTSARWVADTLKRNPVSRALPVLPIDPAGELLPTVLIDPPGNIVAGNVLPADVLARMNEPLRNAVGQGGNSGRLTVGNEAYLWGMAAVPQTPYRLVVLHRADEEGISLKSFGIRMLVAGAIVIWFAVWGSLIISGYISRRLDAQNARLVHQALHDDLTGLPNRRLLYDRLSQAILQAQRHHKPVALMSLDLNGFKEINDTLGHQAGDSLLEQIGPRLRQVLRQSDTVARLGGDDFAILLPDAGLDDAHICAGKIQTAFHEPCKMKALSLRVGSSIGIACYPANSDEPETLIRQAEVAMHHAKATHQDVTDYTRELDPNSVERLTLLSDLQKSIECDQLVFHYQPKIDVKTRQIMGAEALVRWTHPERGLVSPSEFIPLAEQTGFIRPLTYWGIKEALDQCRSWCRQDLRVSVAVNISARCLHDARFAGVVLDSLRTSGLKPDCLEFEVTESAIMLEPERSRAMLREFRSLGITLSIDDFGTGFTSLSYLKDLPIDKVKIDRSFVMNMLHNDRDAILVRSIIDLAHNMGYQVVAEGVEDEKTWTALESLGCDLIQGYYVARPMPASAIEDWVGQSQWKMVANF